MPYSEYTVSAYSKLGKYTHALGRLSYHTVHTLKQIKLLRLNQSGFTIRKQFGKFSPTEENYQSP